jgi:hypothetical protein
MGFKSMGFKPVLTKDGSPTYRFQKGPILEDMHSSRGAFSETLAIYGPVVALGFYQAQCFDSLRGPKFLSVGLGLGYNEFLIGALARFHLMEWECDSYESEPELRADFLDFVFERDLTPDTQGTYSKILKLFENDSRLKPAALGTPRVSLRQALCQAFQEGRWRIHGALDLPAENKKNPADKNPSAKDGKFREHTAQYDGFLWDAFSKKTSPELWEPAELTQFLRTRRSESSFFSTYACFSSLKEALTGAGFQIQIRHGVTGKRESLFGRSSELISSSEINFHQELFQDTSSRTR